MNYGEGGLSASDVALINGSGRNSDGFGDNNSWWVVLFLIVLFGGWGRGGYGGFGCGNNGNGGTSVYEGYVLNNDFSQLSRQLSDATAMTERKLDGVNNGLCSLGYQELQNINGVNMNIANATAGIQNTLTQGFSGINTGMVQQGYETRNAITQGTIAEMQNTNAIQTQLASCCCDLKGISKDNRYENLQNINMLNNSINNGFVSVQQANCLNTRDIISAQENGTRAILDAITQNRLEDLRETNRLLRDKNASLELSASQARQTNEIINTIRPCPIPSYSSCNPWGCNCVCGNNNGCGC